jgi:hypothetical protein
MGNGGLGQMAHYVLRRGAQELYAMNLILSEDEARQYGSEGHMVVVKAIYVWTRIEDLESFQHFLPHSTMQTPPMGA